MAGRYTLDFWRASMKRLPKQIKWQLNQLVDQAYENELSQALQEFAAQVDKWRASETTAGELAHWIHKYDTGPLREMYKQYNSPHIEPELHIASALQRGLLQESHVPEEVWPYLQNAMAFMRTNVGQDDVEDD
jgi:hypothetical protein